MSRTSLTAAPLLLLLCGCTPGAGSPPNHLKRPNMLAVDAAGNLLVSDLLNARIVRFDPEGRYMGSIGRRGLGTGELWRPFGVAPLPDGGVAVVDHGLVSLDDSTSYRRRLKVFGPDGGERLAFSLLPPGETEAGWPEDLERVPEGWLVPDQERDLLLIFDRQGRFVRSIGEVAGGPPLSSAGSPKLSGGALWIAEYKRHRVRRITLDGRELLRFGEEGEGPGQFLFPYSLAVAPDDTLLVADLGNYRVQRFTREGRYLSEFAPAPASPDVKAQLMDVAVGLDGRIYLADSVGNRVLVHAADGTPLAVISGW